MGGPDICNKFFSLVMSQYQGFSWIHPGTQDRLNVIPCPLPLVLYRPGPLTWIGPDVSADTGDLYGLWNLKEQSSYTMPPAPLPGYTSPLGGLPFSLLFYRFFSYWEIQTFGLNESISLYPHRQWGKRPWKSGGFSPISATEFSFTICFLKKTHNSRDCKFPQPAA